MNTRPQSEPHLDADQLNAFAEDVLSASERALCLHHLAECAHCREIAFLAGAALPSEEPAPAPMRRFPFAWWPVLSLGAATLAAIVITVALLHHTHQDAAPAAVQVATGSPTSPPQAITSPSPQATTAASMNQVAPAGPKALSALKPSPARKAPPKPESAILNNRQVNVATPSDSAAESVQAGAGAAVPQQLAGTGRAIQTAPAAAALAQPSQAQAGAVAKTEPGYSLHTYDRLETRSSDGFGQIAGTVTDSAGAVIPHARITLDQASGAAHRETLTDAAGTFTIGSLPPGKYRLEISSPGFLAQVREVELGTSQLARVDSHLAVGAVAETVEVQAAAPALNTESASMQSTLPSEEPLQTSVSSGTRTLGLDTAGKLFLSKKAGKHWKTVHGPWKKSVVTGISLAPDHSFKVTTAQGSWLSADGEHWHPAN